MTPRILIILAALLLSIGAAHAYEWTPRTIYNVGVQSGGHVKNVGIVELVEVKHAVNKHWHQVWRRSKDYVVYMTADGEPIVLSPEECKANKKELAHVPDNRSYEARHPYRHEMQEDFKHWGPVTNFALGVAVTGATVVH